MVVGQSKSGAGVGSIWGLGRYLVRRAPRQIVLAEIFLLLASLTEGVSVLLLVPILQLIDPSKDEQIITIPMGPLSGFFGTGIQVDLIAVLVGFVVIITLRSVLIRQKDIFTAALLYDFMNGLRNELFASVAAARWAFLAKIRGSDLNHALTADIDRVHSAAAQFLQLSQTLVLAIVYAGIAFVISPAMTGFAAGIGLLVIVLMTPIRRVAMRFGRTLTSQRREQYRIVSEFLTGVKVAKAANAEPIYVEQLSSTLGAMRASTLRFMRLYTVAALVFQITTTSGLAAFVYVAVVHYRMSYSAIIAMIFLFVRIAPRLTQLQGSMQDMLTNIPALDAILELQKVCDENQEPNVRQSAEFLQHLDIAIRFEDVHFSYGDEGEHTPALSGLSFVIPARQVTAIIGPSGSGKSTVADLVMGLLEPVRGTIFVDEVPLDGAGRRAWRELLAYVPQDSFLLHDTIAANLLFGRPSIGETEMWEALQTANAERFVRNLPQGLQTVVGDRGLRLSGGERQRIALARALLRQPRLLLLDEATSALDWESQTLIAAAIEGLRGQMTVITIAHRPSMIAFADWVVAIDGGRIVETGPYQDLAQTEGSHLQRMLVGER